MNDYTLLSIKDDRQQYYINPRMIEEIRPERDDSIVIYFPNRKIELKFSAGFRDGILTSIFQATSPAIDINQMTDKQYTFFEIME